MSKSLGHESAGRRALSDFGRAVESWRFVLLTVSFDGVCAVVAALIAHAYSSSFSTVIVAAIIGTVGGTVLSLASVGLFQLVLAPYRQRDELQDAHDWTMRGVDKDFDTVLTEAHEIRQEIRRDLGSDAEIPDSMVDKWIETTKAVVQEYAPNRVGWFLADPSGWAFDEVPESLDADDYFAQLERLVLARLDRHVERLREIRRELVR